MVLLTLAGYPFSMVFDISSHTHKMHLEFSYAKISANSRVDQGCLLSACGTATAIALFTRLELAGPRRLLDDGQARRPPQ